MNYQINLGNWGKVFPVPECVANQYLKLASGNSIKVLLYMLCNNGSDISVDEIASKINISIEDVEDAFTFWEQVEVLTNNKGLLSPNDNSIKSKEEPQVINTGSPKTQVKSCTLTPREIADRVSSSKEISFLFSSAEGILEHLLNHTEQRSLIWIYDYLGLNIDVIIMMLQYCKEIGKTNARYIERIAISWHEKEINSHEEAEKEISSLKQRKSYTSLVFKSLGLDRNPTPKELTFIEDWSTKNLSVDLITFAYEKTIDSIGKISFAYINKILVSWSEKGFISREQIETFEQSRNESASNNSNSSYDIDKFDSFALNYTPKPKIKTN